MDPLNISGNAKLTVAIIMGILTGIWLVKAELDDWNKTMDTFLLKHGKILQIFLFSMSIGVSIFYFAHKIGFEKVNIRPSYFWGSLIGGIICGIGLYICGRVPITAISSLAGGKIFSFWVILGFMLAIPSVKLISRLLSDSLYKWSKPISYHQMADGYMALNSAVLWTVILCLALTLLLQYAFGKSSGDKSGE